MSNSRDLAAQPRIDAAFFRGQPAQAAQGRTALATSRTENAQQRAAAAVEEDTATDPTAWARGANDPKAWAGNIGLSSESSGSGGAPSVQADPELIVLDHEAPLLIELSSTESNR